MPDSFFKRAAIVIAVVIGVHGALAATHEGEFWPFSIYPMFSTGAADWEKVVVRDMTHHNTANLAPTYTLNGPEQLATLPGGSYALRDDGIHENDLANFVERTAEWDAARQSQLLGFFPEPTARPDTLVLFSVTATLADEQLRLEARPTFRIDSDVQPIQND